MGIAEQEPQPNSMAGDQRWSPSSVLSPPSLTADAPPLPVPLARKAALRASTQRACSSADAGSSRSMPRTAGQQRRGGKGQVVLSTVG
jgi:hypothetical protein